MAKKTTAPIITEISGHAVATITLRRPDIHNAFDDELIERLRRELQCLENDPLSGLLSSRPRVKVSLRGPISTG